MHMPAYSNEFVINHFLYICPVIILMQPNIIYYFLTTVVRYSTIETNANDYGKMW